MPVGMLPGEIPLCRPRRQEIFIQMEDSKVDGISSIMISINLKPQYTPCYSTQWYSQIPKFHYWCKCEVEGHLSACQKRAESFCKTNF